MGTEKSRSIKLATTLFGLLIFVALLWFLSKNVSLFDDMLNLRLFSSYAKNLSSKLLVALSLFFVFKILHIFIIEIALSKLRTYLVNESRFASIKKLFGFFWWLLYVVLVLSILIGNVGAFVASIGLVGLGLTFALQKPILNFVGWLTIIVKNIYSEGDRIKIGNTVGDVKEIQLMNTVLAGILENTNTRSHKIITVPNELVLTTDIQNYNKDSNYIMDELLISITYKSNYHAAMGLLDDIVSKHLKENFNSYWKRSEDYELLKNLSNLSFKRIKISKNKVTSQKNKKHEKEIKKVENLEEEFKPKIRIELASSSILLIAQFLTPYDQVKKNRTKINVAFLDAIAKRKDIRVAYPHVQLIYDKNNRKDKKKDKS